MGVHNYQLMGVHECTQLSVNGRTMLGTLVGTLVGQCPMSVLCAAATFEN